MRLTNRKNGWKKLDNAAKIFPALVSPEDTEVFRISCTLHEEVDPALLQQALDFTMEEFPSFSETVSRGMFWYYLEDSGKKPQVHEETATPLQPLYTKNTHGLLIDVSYYKRRINFEVFHAICDGTGAVMFLRTLVAHYLCLRHGLPMTEMDLGIDFTVREKEADSFAQHYEKDKGKGNGLGLNEFLGDDKKRRIYRFNEPKTPDFRQLVTEGAVSVGSMKKAAAEYGTTLTVFLISVLISAIYSTMEPKDRKKAVSVAVPVNLRNYFESSTARNFFGIIHVIYDFGKHGAEFDAIIRKVSAVFKRELTKENMEKKITSQVGLEQNFGIRMVPLFIKDIAMGISQRVAMKRRTICFSNVGRVEMPSELASYVDFFEVFNSSPARQVCMCSYGDKMVIAFSGVFAEHDVERAFFRMIAKFAAEAGDEEGVTVSTNYSAKEFDER